jgi:ARF7 effector protein C-terminus
MEMISDTTFLHDFNPLNSRREKNKQKNVTYGNRKSVAKKYYTAMYDEHGKLKNTGQDICDCFDEACEGCHFPCEVRKSKIKFQFNIKSNLFAVVSVRKVWLALQEQQTLRIRDD